MIKVNEVSTSYGKKQVLDSVSFETRPGEILGVLGENGSGKSTLIKSICNILPHGGSCFCNDKQLEKLSAKELARICSYVPQKSGLEIEMPVLDVVLMGFNAQLNMLANPTSKMIEKAKGKLAEIGFEDKIDADYMSLSEGQKQLCILLRAMVADSKVLLMDEPENALDIRMRHKMMTMLREWIDAGERTALVALHDIEIALNYCDRLLLIKDGKNAGIIVPGSDTIEGMEATLSNIYGKCSLRRIEDNAGKMHIVMLKEM